MFCPSRFCMARRRRGFTKKALAEKIGVSSRIVLAYETGEHTPSDETLRLISEALDFPLSFFIEPEISNLPSDSVSFRALTNLTATKRDAALSAGQVAILIGTWLEGKFNLPAADIPNLRNMGPEVAAETLRAQWGLGHATIKNMVHLLESKGVRVFSLPSKDADVDAFCFWRDRTPFILLNTTKTGERSRFDAAHELAHLVLHRHGEIQGREAELEADRFASALLMPKSSVLSVVAGVPVTIERILTWKSKWHVSAMALCYRLRAVGILTEWTYTQLCKELSIRGYRKAEKNGIERETSQVIAKVLKSLTQNGVSRQSLTRELHLNSSELNALMFGLLPTLISGGGSNSKNRSTDHLTLV